MGDQLTEDEYKQLDKHILNINKRKCTDVICLIFYILVSVFFLAMTAYYYFYGNMKQLQTAYDPDGKGCGLQHKEYPFIYFLSPQNNLLSSVCVKHCPKSTDTILKCAVNSLVLSCYVPSQIGIYDTYERKPSYMQTRVCVCPFQPNSNSYQIKLIELLSNYHMIGVSLVVSFLLSIIIMRIVQRDTGSQNENNNRILLKASSQDESAQNVNNVMRVIFTLNIIIVILLVAFLVATSFFAFLQFPILTFNKRIIIGALLILFAIYVIVLYKWKKRILLASKYMIEVSKLFVSNSLWQCFKLSLSLIILALISIGYWLFALLSYISNATIQTQGYLPPFYRLKFSDDIIQLGIAHTIYLIWTLVIFVEISNFVVKGAAIGNIIISREYFSETKQLLKKKHMGSVILGSFLTLLIAVPEALFQFIRPNTKAQSKNKCYKFYQGCYSKACCLCQMLFFQICNSQSFTLIIYSSDNYITASRRSYQLYEQQKVLSSSVKTLISIFSLVIKSTVIYGTILVMVVLIEFVDFFREKTTAVFQVIILACILSFIMISFNISIYVDSVQAVFMTYLKKVAQSGKEALHKEKDSDQQSIRLKQFLKSLQKQEQKIRKEQDGDESQYQ